MLCAMRQSLLQLLPDMKVHGLVTTVSCFCERHGQCGLTAAAELKIGVG